MRRGRFYRTPLRLAWTPPRGSAESRPLPSSVELRGDQGPDDLDDLFRHRVGASLAAGRRGAEDRGRGRLPRVDSLRRSRFYQHIAQQQNKNGGVALSAGVDPAARTAAAACRASGDPAWAGSRARERRSNAALRDASLSTGAHPVRMVRLARPTLHASPPGCVAEIQTTQHAKTPLRTSTGFVKRGAMCSTTAGSGCFGHSMDSQDE